MRWPKYWRVTLEELGIWVVAAIIIMTVFIGASRMVADMEEVIRLSQPGAAECEASQNVGLPLAECYSGPTTDPRTRKGPW